MADQKNNPDQSGSGRSDTGRPSAAPEPQRSGGSQRENGPEGGDKAKRESDRSAPGSDAKRGQMSSELGRSDRSNQGEPRPATPGNPDPNTTVPTYTDVPGSSVQGSEPE